jgi:hypothetical protein
MEIHQHVALRRLATDLGVIVHHDLIAALHEIHFNALDSPFLKLIERGYQLVVQGFP